LLICKGPEKQTENFQSTVIFVLRNINTVFPAFQIYKGIAYHGRSGQGPESEWRRTRDEYFQSSLIQWKEMILWWKNADYYKIGLYLPYEDLVDTESGPNLVQRLADQLHLAGFDVAPSKDIPCIWYRMVKEEWKVNDALWDYTPKYTKEQYNYSLHELEKIMALIKDDDELTEILRKYKVDIEENTSFEKSWENRSAHQ